MEIAAPIVAQPRPRASLHRVLGVSFGAAVAVGSIIGAGILRAPSDVAARLPSPLLFIGVWVLGGIYALLGANSMAELGTMLPRSGGQYVYARHAFGAYAGFVVGWNDWVSTCGSIAAVALVAAASLGRLAPPMAGRTTAVALAIVVAAALLLWRGSRESDRAQRWTSALKAAAFLVLVGACFLAPAAAADPAGPAATPRGTALVGALIVALQGVIFAYDGWVGVLYFAEEVRDPGRQIPRAMFGGLASVIAIYLLVNAAFLHVLSLPAMAHAPLVAAAAAAAVFGSHADAVVHAIVVVSLPSAVVANLLMASRVTSALGSDGLAPRALGGVNARGTPSGSLWLTTVVAVLFLATGTFEDVVAVCAFFFVATYGLSFAAVFVLRRREPAAPRPFRAWGYPWTTAIVLAGSLAFLVGAIASDTRNSLYAVALLVASYPAYRIVRTRMTPRP
jgi:APA family basic amino acid/polyamine antiporter